ncbi:MAG: hypothetical protein FJW88_10090 [Actinobacteria bacterium]|nr:hypothetical protein [Actinomycetota bacterium]
MGKQIPIVDYLVLDDGPPHLVANESVETGALYFDRRNADAKSGKPGFRRRRLADTGMVRTFTIVYRAAPGVPTPYVSAVIDVDGGGVVKANLVNVEPDPENVRAGLRVSLTTYVAGTDDEGTEAVAFAYEPIKEA